MNHMVFYKTVMFSIKCITTADYNNICNVFLFKIMRLFIYLVDSIITLFNYNYY